LSRFKRLPGESNGKLRKLSSELNHAHYSYDSLVESLSYLYEIQDVPASGSLTASFQPALYYALVRYSSVFNSSDRKNSGMSRYNAGQIFGNSDRADFHKIILSYRDKEIAHITNFSRKQDIIYDTIRNEVIITGRHDRPQSANKFQPGTEEWSTLIEHLEYCKDWILKRIQELNTDIPEILTGCSPDFVASLPDIDPDVEANLHYLFFLKEKLSKDQNS